jgi:hypothetical protein
MVEDVTYLVAGGKEFVVSLSCGGTPALGE